MSEDKIRKWVDRISTIVAKSIKSKTLFMEFGILKLFFQIYKTRNADIFYFEMGVLPNSQEFEKIDLNKDVPIFSTRLKNMRLKNKEYAPDFSYSPSSTTDIEFLKESIIDQANYVFKNICTIEKIHLFIVNNDTIFVTKMDQLYWKSIGEKVRSLASSAT